MERELELERTCGKEIRRYEFVCAKIGKMRVRFSARADLGHV